MSFAYRGHDNNKRIVIRLIMTFLKGLPNNKRDMIDDRGGDGARSLSTNSPAANADNVEGGSHNKHEKNDVK